MSSVELGAEAFWLLILAGMLSGVASLWAFRRWSDTAKLRRAVNRIVAHLLELSLFAGEPTLVMRAQRDLFAANGEFLRRVTVPSLLLVLPFSIFLIAMDALFARASLQPGRPAIVTLQCSHSLATGLPQARLDAPAGIQVETPPVRVPAKSQISWRVRPLQAASGKLQIHYAGRLITKSISSTPGLQWLPFSIRGVNFIAISYPTATVFNLNWLVWFSAGSVAGALTSGLASGRA